MWHRPELFHKTQFGVVEPFGHLHKFRAEDVDTVMASRDCNRDEKICEEISAGQGAKAAG